MSGFEDDERFDGLYLNVAQTTRGIEPLLDTVFSFLRRKTDFFAGPPGSENGTEAAIAKVNEVLQKHAKQYEAENKKSSSSSSSKKPAAAKAAATNVEKKKEAEVIEMGQDGEFDISNSSQASNDKKDTKTSQSTPAAAAATTATATATTSEAAPKDTKKDDDKMDATDDDDNNNDKSKDKPPVGNGGTVPGKYVWTQTLQEVTVTIPVPDNTRGRDLTVVIARNHLKVGLKKTPKDFIMNAPLCKTIICDDSFWTVEDGNRLIIQLQKSNQMEWWDCVCQGDPTIDVTKIQPESSNLSDLDGETRKTVEKMMFDQRQKAMGLPTSDEQTKLDALERFKQQHPELDFSNAKIS